MSLSALELLQLTLRHPTTQKQLNKTSVNISRYIDIIENYKVGENIAISTYDEYLNVMPHILKELKLYISESEYRVLVLFKCQIDYLVLETFKDLI